MTRKQKFLRISLILAVVLAIAILVEILFSTIERMKQPKTYEVKKFSVSDFSINGLEKEGNGYKTLTEDAYFELSDIGFSSAQSIDLFMKREAWDVSECVLRFKGKSNGVYGTFVVGIKKVEENIYRAVADFDSIENIKIYISEEWDTRVEFNGIEINRYIEKGGFSFYRIFLWAAIAVGLYRIVLEALRYKRKKKISVSWLGVYSLLLPFIAVFSYISCSMFWTTRQVGFVLIPLAIILFTLAYIFIYIIVSVVKTVHRKVFVLFLVAGIAFTFATAPLQAPDEGNHFARCYAISMGSFGFIGDFEYPDEVNRLYELFPENLKKLQEFQAKPSAMERMKEFLEDNNTSEPSRKVFSNSLLILPYLPSALAIALTKIFTRNALITLYVARLVNVVIVAFSLLFALKRATRNRVPIILLAFFPLTVFMAASTSYDAMLIAAFLVFFGIISKDNISRKDLIILVAVFSFIVLIKPLYLPLAILVFTIPKNSIGFRLNIYAAAGLMLISGVILWQLTLLYANIFSSNVVPSGVLIGVDKPAQVMYITKNPLKFLTVVFVDGFRRSFLLGEYGLFGYLDLRTKLTSIIVPIELTLCSSLSYGEVKERRKKNTVFLLLLLIVMYIVISAGFYVVDSGLGSSTILGVQARYFIPCIYIASALLANLFSNVIRIGSKRITTLFTIYSAFIVSIIAAIEIFAGYYFK